MQTTKFPQPETIPTALAAQGLAWPPTVAKLIVPSDAIDVLAQARKFFEPEFVGRLAEAMKVRGQTWPVKCRRSPIPGRWILLAGEQRYRALKMAGITQVWVIEVEGPLSEADILEEQLQENGLRMPLRPCEEGEALERLRQLRGGCSSTELAKLTKLNLTCISRRLSLLRYSPDQRARIDAGELPETVASELAKLTNDLQRATLFEKACQEKWSCEQAISAVSQLTKRRRKPKVKPATPLKRVSLRLGVDGAMVAVHCPQCVEELTTTEVVYALEFALKEAKRAMKLKVEARALAPHFQQLPPPLPKTSVSNGHTQLASLPAATEFPNPEPKE